MDKKVESLLIISVGLVSSGVAMIQSIPAADAPGALTTQLIGFGMILAGVAVMLFRGNQKEKNVSKYVKRKIQEYDES